MTRLLIVFASALQILTMDGDAVAQSAPPEICSKAGYLSLDRGIGQGKVEIKCAEGESTKICLEAALPIISQGQGQIGVVYATTSLKCGDTIYQVSTGTKTGSCGPTAGTGGQGISCTDGGKLVSAASCVAGCGTSNGAGSCTISAK